MEGSFISLPVYEFDDDSEEYYKKRVRINLLGISSIEPSADPSLPGNTEIEMLTGRVFLSSVNYEDFSYLVRSTTFIL